MSTSKLQLYNAALRHLGERALASLSEARKPRRDLDSVWDAGLIGKVLSMGQWNFATRTVQLDYSPSIEPDFGFRRAFDHPEDWVRTTAVCTDEYFKCPLLEYKDEASFWFADCDVLYVGFVSKDEQYGADLSKWPDNFVAFAELWLAAEACVAITQNVSRRDELVAERKQALKESRSTDAMDDPSKPLPAGTWSTARRGTASQRYLTRNSY